MISRYQKTKGFTLIELLVVISIISLLSSIVLSSVSSARDKARIAAGQQFSSHNYQGFAADAALIWNFNEPSGNAMDYSQNNIFGVLTNITRSTTDIPIRTGASVIFNGSNSVIVGTVATAISIPTFTVSFWFKPSLTSAPLYYLADTTSDRPFYIYINGTYNLYVAGNPCSAYSLTNVVKTQKWQHLAVSYDSGKYFSVFIDGKFVAKASSQCNLTSSTFSTVVLGRYGGSGANYFNGLMDDFVIFNQSLTAYNIHQLYAEGLPRHTLAEAN